MHFRKNIETLRNFLPYLQICIQAALHSSEILGKICNSIPQPPILVLTAGDWWWLCSNAQRLIYVWSVILSRCLPHLVATYISCVSAYQKSTLCCLYSEADELTAPHSTAHAQQHLLSPTSLLLHRLPYKNVRLCNFALNVKSYVFMQFSCRICRVAMNELSSFSFPFIRLVSV